VTGAPGGAGGPGPADDADLSVIATQERLVRASAAVALGTLLSRITGLVRVVVLAYAIGRASLADAYNLANTTPNIIYELVLGGVLSATLVPIFVEHLERRDDRATSAVFTVSLAAVTVLTFAGFLVAPWIARLYSIDASGAERAAQLDVMTFLIRCFVVQMVFYALTALATTILNARRRYVAAAYAPVLNNVIVVGVLLVFVGAATGPQNDWVDVQAISGDTGLLLLLGLGTTAGIAAMGLALVPALRAAHVRLRPVFEWTHPSVRTMLRLSSWTVGYVVANQLALLFVLVLAQSGDTGNVSAYQYAFIFFQLPHGLFAVSIMTTTAPEFARHAARGDRDALSRDFSVGLRYLLLVVAPAATAFVVLAQPAVGVLVRGGFGAHDAVVTADVLQLLAIGLLPFSVYLYSLRVYYAQQDTRTPFFVNLFENALNVALALALFSWLGVQGLALAYAGAYTCAAVAVLVLLRRRLGSLHGAEVRASARRALVGCAALALAAAPVAGAIGSDGALESAVAALAGGLAGGVVYLVVLQLLGADELAAVLGVLRRRRTPA
jgi:putative peptidoglycan lipid II flippase